MTMNAQRKLVVMDDETAMADFVRDVASGAGFSATAVTDLDGFWRHVDGEPVVVVVDLVMPGQDGIEVLRELADRGHDGKVVLMSGYDAKVLGAAVDIARSRGLDVMGALFKPFSRADLLAVLSQPGMSPPRHTPNALERVTAEEIRQGIVQGCIVPFLQPKIDLRRGTLCGAEALARWYHPEKGLLPPNVFIPVAEAAGLISAMTYGLMEDLGGRPDLWECLPRVALNVSAVMLDDLALPETIAAALGAAELSPSRVTLEITESGAIQEAMRGLEVLTRLRLRGMGLSIDDFGTGFSTMKQLVEGPFTELKIDQMFVRRLDRSPEAEAMVASMIDLGHHLGLTVVAEGVETDQQAAVLRRLGCDVVQGYLYGRPMTVDDFVAWARDPDVRPHRAEIGGAQA